MHNVAEQLFYHTKIYNKTLKRLCRPLEDFFGVTDVAAFFAEGDQLINIHTNTKWMEFCMEKEYYKEDPHIIEPEQLNPGFTVCSYYPSEQYLSGLVKDSMDFGMYHGVTYIHPRKNGYHAVSLDTAKENVDMPNKIINNPKSIVKFMDYLATELQPVFKKLADNPIKISSLTEKQNASTQKNITKKLQLERERKAKFLTQLGIVTNNSSNFSLSNKEKICLQYYLAGKTAADTAAELGISRRTIENYIDNVKLKLNCRFKKDLFDKIDILECLGLLN